VIAEAILKQFSDIILKSTGMVFLPEAYPQLENAIFKIIKLKSLKSPDELLGQYKNKPSPEMIQVLIDNAIVEDTSFFRDVKPFTLMVKSFIPDVLNHYPNDQLKIWSCGSSSGQEAYSIIMSIKNVIEASLNRGYGVDVSDISNQLLNKAKSGIYNGLEIQSGLPVPMMVKYFQKIDEGAWQVSSTLTEKCNFFQFNVLADKFPDEKYHIIFCRNLLQNQSLQNKRKIIEDLYSSLKNYGVLILGIDEKIDDLNSAFRLQKIDDFVYFQKNENYDIPEHVAKFFIDKIAAYTGKIYAANEVKKLGKKLKELSKKLTLKSVDELYSQCLAKLTPAMKDNLINYCTDQETFFFRDVKLFSLLTKSLLPEISSNSPEEEIKIWSNACATGEEVYSIIMAIKNNCEDKLAKGYMVDCSDVSAMVIEKARNGIFNTLEIQAGLPASLIVKYFQQFNTETWQVRIGLMEKCSFFQFNLINGSYSANKYHVIFCRNVLSGMSAEEQVKIANNLFNSLKNNGILILGANEKLESGTKFKLVENEIHNYYLKMP